MVSRATAYIPSPVRPRLQTILCADGSLVMEVTKLLKTSVNPRNNHSKKYIKSRLFDEANTFVKFLGPMYQPTKQRANQQSDTCTN